MTGWEPLQNLEALSHLPRVSSARRTQPVEFPHEVADGDSGPAPFGFSFVAYYTPVACNGKLILAVGEIEIEAARVSCLLVDVVGEGWSPSRVWGVLVAAWEILVRADEIYLGHRGDLAFAPGPVESHDETPDRGLGMMIFDRLVGSFQALVPCILKLKGKVRGRGELEEGQASKEFLPLEDGARLEVLRGESEADDVSR